MSAHPTISKTSTEEKNILLPLLYFDIFMYPLTEEEIRRFAPGRLPDNIRATLASLTQRRILFCIENYYALKDDVAAVERRKNGNRLAEKKLRIARKLARLIGAFPFVRAVMLSGSISKGYMDERSDIDYFIITESGKLWLVRTALALFRRVFLLNSHKYFCTNYFVGRHAMEIGEKNIFTAVETTTLRPMYGKVPVHEFQAANSWCDSFLPNRTVENGLGNESDFFLKKIGERLLSSSIFAKLDPWLMEKSRHYWKNRYGKLLSDRDFLIAFQSTRDVSRSHPQFYQKKVLAEFSEKIRSFEQHLGISLSA